MMVLGKILDAGAQAFQNTVKQATETASDVVEGAGKMVQGAVETLDQAVQNAGQAAADYITEASAAFNGELKDIGDAMQEGNLLKALAEANEFFNPGVHVANNLAALGFGPDDAFAKNLMSAGVNLVAGNAPAVVKDLIDAGQALAATETSGTTQPAPPHTPERPKDAACRARTGRGQSAERGTRGSSRARGEGARFRDPAKEAARQAAKERAKTNLKLTRMEARIRELENIIANLLGQADKIGDGYADSSIGGGSVAEQLEKMMKQIEALIARLKGDPGPVKDRFCADAGWLERMRGNEGSEVSKLPPNATFEDLVAAFMIDVMKSAQEDVKAKMDELAQMNQDKQMLNTLKQLADGGKMTAEMLGMIVGTIIAPGIGTGIGASVGKMAGEAATGGDTLANKKEELEDSRQLLFEQMKNSMNRLQQMMQALSNVLNTMHEGAMNSIRNIK